jgi:hypothetical protein
MRLQQRRQFRGADLLGQAVVETGGIGGNTEQRFEAGNRSRLS